MFFLTRFQEAKRPFVIFNSRTLNSSGYAQLAKTKNIASKNLLYKIVNNNSI